MKATRGLARAGIAIVWFAGQIASAQISFAQSDAAAQTVEMVTGESLIRTGLVSADATQFVFTEGSPVPLDDVRLIRFAAGSPGNSPAAGPVVHLVSGGRLPIENAVLIEDACRATLPGGRAVTLSLDDVTAIQWISSSDPAWAAALVKPSEEYDFVVAQAMPQVTVIRAFVEGISAETIEFDWDKQARTLPRTQVIGVVLARPEAESGAAKIVVHCHSGAVVPAKELRRREDGAAYVCTLPGGSVLEMPTAEVESIRVRSARVTYLSDLQPATVKEQPIVALPRSWQSNRNVRGEPLRAGAQAFEKGLGVQSGSSLSYDLDGHAEQFVAVLSLDPPATVAGDCEFVIVADDRELARQQVKAGDPPVPIRLSLAGARRLELRVEYGQNLDFGDHANWCDAHLVLERQLSGEE